MAHFKHSAKMLKIFNQLGKVLGKCATSIFVFGTGFKYRQRMQNRDSIRFTVLWAKIKIIIGTKDGYLRCIRLSPQDFSQNGSTTFCSTFNFVTAYNP